MVGVHVKDAVARARIPVARLSYAAGIDDEAVTSARPQDAERFGENAGQVRVPHEAYIRVKVLELLLSQEKGFDTHPAFWKLGRRMSQGYLMADGFERKPSEPRQIFVIQ